MELFYFISTFFYKKIQQKWHWMVTESNIKQVVNSCQFLCYVAIRFSKGKGITLNSISLMTYLET